MMVQSKTDKVNSPTNLANPYHDEHHHDHGDSFLRDPRRVSRLKWAFSLTLLMMVGEAIGGIYSGSLALLADAGHMLVDAGALGLAWMAAVFARRPADSQRSYGYARLEVLIGYSNAILQVILVLWIFFEAVGRLIEPQTILSAPMLFVAFAGLMVNLLVLTILGGHDHDDVNAAGAFLHVLGDLLGSIGAILAALLIEFLGWSWTDALISGLISLLILNSAWRLLRRTAHILLEGVPDGIEMSEVAQAIERECPSVADVHHVHVWQLTGGSHIATLHASLVGDTSPADAIRSIRRIMHERYGVNHITVQLDEIRPAGNEGACKLS